MARSKDRRRAGRVKVNLKARRISGGAKHGVLIENISEKGIHVLTDPEHKAAHLSPGEKVDIDFQLPSGESLNLHCRVRWAHERVPPGRASSVGIEVLKPPAKYIKFVKSLE